MYTSYIGKKFLNLYNNKNNKNLSAEDFFNQILFDLFFNHEKHFINVANSSFFQSVPKIDQESGKSVHLIKLERFHKNVKEDGASLTTLVGYSSQDVFAGTSGQTTSMQFQPDQEEMYASWIGIGMAISMGGGFSMLIDKDEILMFLFEGWKYYRSYLQQTPNLKGNQIEVWNSYWIVHCLSKDYNKQTPLANFSFPEYFQCKADKWKKMGFNEFVANQWSVIIFSLSKRYAAQVITACAFKYADMNQTLGFINIFLPEVNKMYEIRDKIFLNHEESILSDKEIEQFSTYYYFKSACQLGTIGLKAMEPAKLREYMPKGCVMYAQGKDFKFSDEESYHIYQLYKIWIIAMLNKTDLLNLASSIGSALINLEKKDERGKTVLSNLSKEVRDSKSIKVFIESLSNLIEQAPENASTFRKTVEEVLQMPSDNFPLFITLIRFEYNYQKSQN